MAYRAYTPLTQDCPTDFALFRCLSRRSELYGKDRVRKKQSWRCVDDLKERSTARLPRMLRSTIEWNEGDAMVMVRGRTGLKCLTGVFDLTHCQSLSLPSSAMALHPSTQKVSFQPVLNSWMVLSTANLLKSLFLFILNAFLRHVRVKP